MRKSLIAYAALAGALCCTAPLHAQIEAEVDGVATVSGAGEDNQLAHWWLGAYFRHLWVPSYLIDVFLDRGPSVANNGFGLVGTYRTGEGFNVQFGFGYMPLAFDGPLLAPGGELTDVELAKSDLSLIHATGSVLWDIEFHKTIALEFGVGLDLGVFTGDVERTEAFRDMNGKLRRCTGPLDPATSEDLDGDGVPEPYCALPENGSGLSGTDDPEDEGEHYGVNATGIPPVFGFVMLPHVALRIQPHKYFAIKGEFAFGFATIFAGVSIHGSFGMFGKGPKEVVVSPDAAPVPVTPEADGRVLGKVLDDESGAPVAGATVKLKARALSPVATEDDGRFVVDRLDSGVARFEVEHPDYAKGRCEVEVPEEGGDVALECRLAASAKVGALSGQLEDEKGAPLAGVTVELSGARSERLLANDSGVFAAVDLPAGMYRARVDAEGYLVQMLEFEVLPRETATPRIILIKKPERSLVELRKEEIVISEQVQFKTGSAEILAESEMLLRQIADVLLRNPQITRVEVQGHTDSRGGHAMNMKLSQARAESVSTRLTQAGVPAERLESQGYGPDSPIRPNDTAENRAKNRRVQFIIRKQD